MLQNKIYLNFFFEIIKTFLVIVSGLSMIALTVRAVNFLELIVENGYPVTTYFQYSFLNLFGIAPKFIPLAFLVAIIIFILKHLNDSEFIILWTSGVKKIQIVNLFLFSSTIVLLFYLIFSVFLTPYALNKSRSLLGNDKFNLFLPTIRAQQFSDSFKGFTFIVEDKFKNEIKNIFLHDTGSNLSNLTTNVSNSKGTTVVAQKGIVEKKKMILLNGQIISSKQEGQENEIIKFEQLNIDLAELATTTIKKPKIQETSTLKLAQCFNSNSLQSGFCNKEAKKEILPVLLRRLILPLYIPVITIISSFLLIKNHKIFLNKISIFIYSFLILLFTELSIRYTGINYFLRVTYTILPFILASILYFFLKYKFLKESQA